MEKLKLNFCMKGRQNQQVKRTETLEPKGTESGYNGFSHIVSKEQSIPGLQEVPKVS